MNDDKRIQRIVACAFIHKDGKLFVARRADTKKFLPGKYELPGGHIEFGETMADGLQREIMEEIGAEAVIGDPFYVFTYTQNNETIHTIEVDYFATLKDPNRSIRLHPDDHSDYHWITRAEIFDYFDGNDEEARAAEKGFEMLNEGKR